MFALNHAGEQYVLNEDALAHLDDCHDVISSARFTLDIVALAALAACVIVGARHGSRSLGSALVLEFLLHYMTRPEYQLNVREEIYLDNTLDLF